MNIIFISPHPGFGGASTANQNIAKMLSEKNNVTYIDEFLDYPSYPESKIKYSKYPLHKNRIFKQIQTYKYLQRTHADYILIGVPQICIYYLIILAILRIKGVKIGFIFHSIRLSNSIKNRIMDFSIAISSIIASKLFFVSQYTLETWSSYRTIRNHPQKHVVYNAIDLPTNITPKINSHIKNIIYVGRFSEEKQPEIFCKIAQKLYTKYKFTAWGDGELKKGLEEKYSSYVTFKGFTNNQELIYSDGDLLIVTSQFENCPMILLEAWGHGIPCIAPHVGGIPEIVRNNKNGELYSNFNIDDIIKKIERINSNYQLYVKASYQTAPLFTLYKIGRIWNELIKID